ncbi:MAG: hypothetical protein HY560_09645 [Gemmatimonadetes bacterium]|nr:hypothetical protein [Gemmatimonadota bacterium]
MRCLGPPQGRGADRQTFPFQAGQIYLPARGMATAILATAVNKAGQPEHG